MQIAQKTCKYIPMIDEYQNTNEEEGCSILGPWFYISPFYSYLPAIMMGTDQGCSGLLYKIIWTYPWLAT